MDSHSQFTVEQLIEYVTQEDIETPDINAQIEIASRFVANKKDLVLGLRCIDIILRKGKIKKKYFALCLLEVCSKNGDVKLHEQVCKQKFLESFMTLLKSRRGKKGILIKKEKGLNKVYKEWAENKALYLIQLWADTFMMHQDTFAGVHECYRLLRQERVEFPEREANERLMMENLKGIDSPMFDFVEQLAGKSKPKDLEEIKKDKIYEENNRIIEVIDESGNEELQAFEENEDFTKYCRSNYDRTEFEVAKSTIMILEDMCNNAEEINDLRTETVKDVYTTCRIARLRIAKIVEVRSFANLVNDLESLLEVIDFLDKKLDAFKAKYNKLKAKDEKKQKAAKEKKEEKAQEAKEDLKEEHDQEFPDLQDESEEEEGQEIGNIDLLELGLGDEPEQEEKVKPKREKKEKKEKKIKSKKEKVESTVSQDKESEPQEGKKKLLAPPPGVRKLNSVNNQVQQQPNKENNQPQSDIMDLLEF